MHHLLCVLPYNCSTRFRLITSDHLNLDGNGICYLKIFKYGDYLPMTLSFYKGILFNQVLFVYLHVITDAHISPKK